MVYHGSMGCIHLSPNRAVYPQIRVYRSDILEINERGHLTSILYSACCTAAIFLLLLLYTQCAFIYIACATRFLSYSQMRIKCIIDRLSTIKTVYIIQCFVFKFRAPQVFFFCMQTVVLLTFANSRHSIYIYIHSVVNTKQF